MLLPFGSPLTIRFCNSTITKALVALVGLNRFNSDIFVQIQALQLVQVALIIITMVII